MIVIHTKVESVEAMIKVELWFADRVHRICE